jgi:hypothetical protein
MTLQEIFVAYDSEDYFYAKGYYGFPIVSDLSRHPRHYDAWRAGVEDRRADWDTPVSPDDWTFDDVQVNSTAWPGA